MTPLYRAGSGFSPLHAIALALVLGSVALMVVWMSHPSFGAVPAILIFAAGAAYAVFGGRSPVLSRAVVDRNGVSVMKWTKESAHLDPVEISGAQVVKSGIFRAFMGKGNLKVDGIVVKVSLAPRCVDQWSQRPAVLVRSKGSAPSLVIPGGRDPRGIVELIESIRSKGGEGS